MLASLAREKNEWVKVSHIVREKWGNVRQQEMLEEFEKYFMQLNTS